MLVKKSESYDTPNRLYVRKRSKSSDFENSLSESGWWSTEICFKKATFLLKTFFQRLLENFLCVVWPCSIYLEGCLRSYLYARKKNQSHTRHQTDYMSGNIAKTVILKNSLSESGWWSTEMCFKKAIFLLKTVFQRLLENFLCVVWPCSIYLEGCLRSYLYAREKIRVIRHAH